MRRRSLRTALLLACALVAGCQSTPPELILFTTGLRERYGLTDDELRRLQYFLSDKLVLERVATRGQRSIRRGRIVDRSGTLVERVVIEYGTPGIVEAPSLVGLSERGKHAIEVSFAPGEPIMFVSRSGDGSYGIRGASGGGGIFDELFEAWGLSSTEKVRFGGSEWRAVAGGEVARLLIERDALGEIVRRKRILPGVRLPR